MAIRAAVLGASGFAGGELLRLLNCHPALEVVAAGASSQAGRPVTQVFPALQSFSDIEFCSLKEALDADAEILFSSLPHGESSKLLTGRSSAKVVDLAGDFRLRDPAARREWYGDVRSGLLAPGEWAYGLTEFHREEISSSDTASAESRASKKVANPGCYAAATILALAPLLEAGLVEPAGIHITAMSGVSGAGRAQGQGVDFVSANENVRPYKPIRHNHIGEIEQELSFFAGRAAKVSFVPHLVPMNRGILVTAAAPAAEPASAEELIQVLRTRYEGEPFVRVLQHPSLPETRRLSGTNFAEVAATPDERTGNVLAFAAIDSLGKGAAGQAVQNANLMLGLDETTGLLVEGLIP